MIIITGCGRCGTSVLAQVLQRCGYDFKTDCWRKRARGGLEHKQSVRLNYEIFGSVKLLGNEWMNWRDIDNAVVKYRDSILQLPDNLEIVKDPRISKTLEVWVRAGLDIDLIIICLRDHWEAAKSAQVWDAAYQPSSAPLDEIYREFLARSMNCLSVCMKHDLNFKLISYPCDYKTTLPLQHLVRAMGLNQEKVTAIVSDIFEERSY